MFEKLKYRWKTDGFFNPNLNIDVSRDQFLQVLRGEVVNPNMLTSVKYGEDHHFMVVGVPEGSALNSWAGKNWGQYGYEKAHERVSWYARVSCEEESKLVFPSKNLYFKFDSHSKKSEKKAYPSSADLEFVLFKSDSERHIDNGLKVLVSDLAEEEVLGFMRDYRSLFSAEKVFLY